MASTRFSRPVFAACAALAALALAGMATPAAAQMYPGANVSVNPAGTGRVLLRPDGKGVRVLPPLRQPGQFHPGGSLAPVNLHMPRHRHHVRTVHRAAPAQPHVAERHAAAPEPVPQSAPQPAPKAPAMVVGGALGGSENLSSAPPPPPKQKMAAIKPAPAVTPAPGAAGGPARQAVILFEEDSAMLGDANTARLKDLAASLSAALDGGARHIELVGYAGQPGEKDSNTRRLSLKRVIAVRRVLISAGLPANRIDVRALGGVEDNGATDRVDIFVKG